MIRSIPSRVLQFPRGRYSSMMDMGGMGTAKTDTKLDTGKNNKVRAIALDFDLITRSVDAQRSLEEKKAQQGLGDKPSSSKTPALSKSIEPSNINIFQDIANLLNVKLGDNDIGQKKKQNDDDNDDLSRLIGNSKSSEEGTKEEKDKESSPQMNIPTMDIRAKYAKKLRSKMDGGIQGIDLAKTQKEEALKRGDAASGHFEARSLAAANSVTTSGSKWLALTGTGALLTYLNSRSMKIILMPQPGFSDSDVATERARVEQDRMISFAKQLPNIKFDLMIKGLSGNVSSSSPSESIILDKIISELSVPQISTLVVSDRDDYLRSARDKGMFTCRVRQKNQPRGNVTTNYNVEDLSEVEEVLNEVNGISFNTVFSKA
jgi:hypothetical protein